MAAVPPLERSQEMPNPIRFVLSVLCLLVMGSCATVIVRSDSGAEPGHVFPATKFDAEAFWAAGVKGEPPITMADPNLRIGPGERLAYGAGSIIDMPFSVVSDVILLPPDLIRIGSTKEKEKSEANKSMLGNPH